MRQFNFGKHTKTVSNPLLAHGYLPLNPLLFCVHNLIEFNLLSNQFYNKVIVFIANIFYCFLTSLNPSFSSFVCTYTRLYNWNSCLYFLTFSGTGVYAFKDEMKCTGGELISRHILLGFFRHSQLRMLLKCIYLMLLSTVLFFLICFQFY